MRSIKEYNEFLPRLSRVKAGKAASAQAIDTASATKVVLENEDYDAFGEFSDSRFTAKSSGYFNISASLEYESSLTGKRYGVLIYKNGAEIGVFMNYSAGNLTTFMVNINITLKLNYSDYIEVYAFHDSGVAKNVVNDAKRTYLIINQLN